jgi:hypothetical protein
MSSKNELAQRTVMVLDKQGKQRDITYHEIATHYAAWCTQGRRTFLERQSPAQLASILAHDGRATLDEDALAFGALEYELFFSDVGLMEWDAIHWLEKMELRLTAEEQADWDVWSHDKPPRNVSASRTRVSQQWRKYRAVRAAFDEMVGYGWWNPKPVWLEPYGYKPQELPRKRCTLHKHPSQPVMQELWPDQRDTSMK